MEWLNYSSNGTSSHPTSIHSAHYLNGGSMPSGTESPSQVPIGGSSSDVDHFYISAASDRVYHPLPRRPLKDSPSFETETLPQSPLIAGLAQCAGNSNKEGHKQKVTERNPLLPFGQEGGNECKEWRHNDSSFSLSRFNGNSPVKHLVLSGSLKRAVENGEQKQGKSLGNSPKSIPTRPFIDRSFPFVGIHEKSVSLQSSLVDDVSSLNGRPSWQNSPKLDGNKTPQWGLGESRTLMPPPVASSLHGNGTGPKMADALLQSSPRVKTPPLQAMAETQRFEELTLMQSRQLIPIIPSLPKTLSQGLSSREKSKSKVGGGGRSLDKPSLKTNLTKVPSQPLSSLSRSSLSTLTIEAGKFQAGMRAAQKANKEVGVGGGLPTTNAPLPSKLKPAAESKAPLDSGVVIPLKDGGTLLEEKRPPVHAQNRSDFFNMLRKKAALRRSLDDDSSVVGKSREDSMKSSDVEALAIATPSFVLERGESPCSEDYSMDMKSLEIVEALEGGMDGNEKCNNNSSVAAIVYSEEEAAFLKSLGWVEGSGEAEEEEGLTEEEINAFLEKHSEVMISRGHRC